MAQITYEQFRSAVDTVKAVWVSSKLFSTKADKQTMLIINSKHTYATIINTKYVFTEGGQPVLLEQLYNHKQFAQDVTSQVMQELLLA